MLNPLARCGPGRGGAARPGLGGGGAARPGLEQQPSAAVCTRKGAAAIAQAGGGVPGSVRFLILLDAASAHVRKITEQPGLRSFVNRPPLRSPL